MIKTGFDMRHIHDMDIKRFGNDLTVSGVLYGNGEDCFIAMLPDETSKNFIFLSAMTSEEWKILLQQTDLMETEILAKAKDGTLTKAIVRKSTRQVDQKISWNVFRRDQYACCYCGNDKTPLTVDHIVLWEEGGATVEDNLITACRPCNKRRGNEQFMDFIQNHTCLIPIDKALHMWEKADATPRKVHVVSR